MRVRVVVVVDELVNSTNTTYDRMRFRDVQWTDYWLTDDGDEAADEILRRHRDGRYSIAFETLE